MNELGWDRSGRAYICLDDKRLYRRTDAPLPPPPAAKLKASSKKAKAAARASKRRKAANGEASATDPEESVNPKAKEEEKVEAEDDGFGGQKWECICIILDEYNDLVASFKKSKDADEVNLHKRLIKEVLPEVEKAEEDRLKKAAKREKELLNDERQRTAKRSSRIASKQDRERQEREEAEAAKMKQSDLIAAKQDLLRQKEMEAARESRMQTREQRLKEREYKRILHEEELANLSDNSKKLEAGEGRLSERHLKAEMEKKKRELEKLNEEDEWFFDCAKCGVHGDNLVCFLSLVLQCILTLFRTMELIVSPAKSVTFGNTVLALESPSKRLKRMISTSCALAANAKKKMQRNPKFLLLSSNLEHLPRHLWIEPNLRSES